MNIQQDNSEAPERKVSPMENIQMQEENSPFVEASSKEDISQLPSLEMRIYHSGTTHEQQNPSDEVEYKLISEKEVISLDNEKMDEFTVEENEEEVSYEDQEKTVSVKKSLIDNYRRKSRYYGPLRIISEKIKVKEKGVVKEAIQAKLQHVEIQATDNEGNLINEHELRILTSQTPGIIPALDPTSETTNEGYTVLNLGREKYCVAKKAMAAFQKLAAVKPPFNTKIQKVFTTNRGKRGPVTVVTLYPRVDKVVYHPVLLDEKKQPIHKTIAKKTREKPKMVNYYRQNYINWSHRGNICFSEIKKIGVDFVDEILIENPIVEDPLKLLGCSLSAFAHNLNLSEPFEDETEESSYPVGSRDFVEELWTYLMTLVRSDNYLIEFEFEMDEEKWLEVKRAFNMFQVDGEVIPDILLKVVSKRKENIYELSYYLRCVGRLVKSGTIVSNGDINNLLKCLSKDKYICVGFSKEPFLRQVDQNNLLRFHMKESCYLSLLPFESIHDQKCKAIVRDSDSIENAKIKRGSLSVFGPSVLCQPCDSLQKKLKELLINPSSDSVPREMSHRCMKQRYAPMQTVNTSENIKSLFVQTPSEFVSGTKRKFSNRKAAHEEENTIKQTKFMEEIADIFQDEKPSIKISEEEFVKMISIKKSPKSNGSLRKECEVCKFEAKSMLALFTHMNDHLGSLNEECDACKMKVSSKEALYNHKDWCVLSKKSFNCPHCHNILPSNEKLFEHMNVHRLTKPFVCSICSTCLQTMYEYKKHIKLLHRVNTVKELNFVCSVCRSYFYTADHLLIHKVNQNHADKEHFRCKICNFSCNLVSAFHMHIMNHTYEERESSNLALCLECKKLFFSSYKMEDHAKKKHGNTPREKEPPPVQTTAEIQPTNSNSSSFQGFTCSKCYKMYGTIDGLQEHVEREHHERVRPSPAAVPSVTCNVCERKFTSDHILNAHMKLHIGNRPVFQCEECGYVYAKRTQVLEHIRSDHAEQVEKHQQLQQEQHQQPRHEMIIETPIYETQHHHHQEQREEPQHPHQQPPPQQQQQSEHQPQHPQPHPYTDGQIITVESQGHGVQQQQSDSWSQLKIPNVEQPHEVGYFPNFNPQFF